MTETSLAGATVGQAFARAIGTKDADALREMLRADIAFMALTPGRFWEADDAETVIDDIVFGRWFEPTDEIQEIISIETSSVGERPHVSYRFRVTNADGAFVVEQQAYYALDEDGRQISSLRVLCSGFVPT